MKKHIFWIVPMVLFLLLAIFDQGANYFNTTWFNVKHVLLFGLIVYVLLLSLYLVYRFFISRYKEKTILKYSLMIVLSAFAVTVTIISSNLQIQYIEAYEVPQIKECTYYDAYGNALYKPAFGPCPEIEIITQTQESLSIKVKENHIGNFYEPVEVDEGIGFRYYEGKIDLDTTIDITYLGPNIQTLSYTMYESMEVVKGEMPVTTGIMYQVKMVNDFELDDKITTTYETRTLNDIDLDNGNFPEFADIDPVINTYVATLIVAEESQQTDRITFEEITYDEEGIEVTNIFGQGTYQSTNEPVIGVDFYREGIHTGSITDYSFKYDNIIIKSRMESAQSTGVDRYYDERTVFYQSLPYDLYNEEPADLNILTDTYLFESVDFEFHKNKTYFDAYDFTYSIEEINDEVYVKQSNGFYHKFVRTEYGTRVEEYEVKKFEFTDLFPEKEDEDMIDVMIDAIHLNILHTYEMNKVMKIYDYKSIMNAPVVMRDYHFYQHNYLIEHFFTNNYEKFDAK